MTSDAEPAAAPSSPEGRRVVRESFTVRLKPGALGEWVRRHQEVWPDLLAEQARCGFLSMTVFSADPVLFVTSEVLDDDSWERLVQSEPHKRWVEAMSDLSESALPDSTMDRGSLPEVFRLVFAEGTGVIDTA